MVYRKIMSVIIYSMRIRLKALEPQF